MTFSLYAMTVFLRSKSEPLVRRPKWRLVRRPKRRLVRRPKRRLVRRPLNAFDIDPLLRHLVKRRKLAQLVDLADHQLGYVIDLFLGVEATEAEANRGVGHL